MGRVWQLQVKLTNDLAIFQKSTIGSTIDILHHFNLEATSTSRVQYIPPLSKGPSRHPRLDQDAQVSLRMRHDTVIPLHALATSRRQLHVESREQIGQNQVHFRVRKTMLHVSFPRNDVSYRKEKRATYVLPMQSVRPFENASTHLSRSLPASGNQRSGLKSYGLGKTSGSKQMCS